MRQTREGIRSMLGQMLATHAEDMKQLTETLKREREDTETVSKRTCCSHTHTHTHTLLTHSLAPSLT